MQEGELYRLCVGIVRRNLSKEYDIMYLRQAPDDESSMIVLYEASVSHKAIW